MQQPFTIRPMAPADVAAVTTIDRLSFPTPWPASSYLYELLESSRSFYRVLVKSSEDGDDHTRRRWYRWIRGALDTWDTGNVAGYVGFRIYRHEAHISTIAIHPNWRGRGLGELLLLETIEAALGLGAHRVTLEVRPSNHVAHKLYRKYGFGFSGMRKGYYRDGEDGWLMAVGVGGNGYRERLKELRLAMDSRLLDERICVGREPSDAL